MNTTCQWNLGATPRLIIAGADLSSMPESRPPGVASLAEENLKRLSRVRAETDSSRRLQGLEERQRQLAMEVEVMSRTQVGELRNRIAEFKERLEQIPAETERLREQTVAAERRRWEEFKALLTGEELPARVARVQEDMARIGQEAEKTAALRKGLEDVLSRAEASARQQRAVEAALEGLQRQAAALERNLEQVREVAAGLRPKAEAAGAEVEGLVRRGQARIDELQGVLQQYGSQMGQVAEKISALESLRLLAEETALTLPKEMERLGALAETVKGRTEEARAQVERGIKGIDHRVAEAESRVQALGSQASAGEERVKGLLAPVEEMRQKMTVAFEQVPLELQALKESVADATGRARENLKKLETVASAAPEALRRGEEAARRMEEFLRRGEGLAREGEGAAERWTRLEARLAGLEQKTVDRAEFEALTRELKAFFDDLIQERERALAKTAEG